MLLTSVYELVGHLCLFFAEEAVHFAHLKKKFFFFLIVELGVLYKFLMEVLYQIRVLQILSPGL